MILFLDTLCEDVTEIIIRNLSSNPRSEHWQEHIKDCDILATFQAGGIFSSVSHRLFDSISNSRARLQAEDRAQFSNIHAKSNWKKTIPELTNHASSSIKHLALSFADWDIDEMRSTEWLARFANKYPSLISLDAQGKANWINAVLPSIGPQLQRIRMSAAFRMESDLSPCTQLRELTLLNSDTETLRNMRFFMKIGKQLEKLYVHFIVGNESKNVRIHISHIQEYCRNLCALNLDVTRHFPSADDTKDEETKCYASYGAQLQQGLVVDLTVAQCRKLREECPNALFEVRSVNLRRLGPLLLELGPSVEKITIQVDMYSDEMEDYEEPVHTFRPKFLDEYIVLKCVRIDTDTAPYYNFACGLFAVKLPQLTEIDIVVSGDYEEMFRRLSLATKKLERLALRGKGSIPNSWNTLVNSNPGLAIVHLNIGNTAYNSETSRNASIEIEYARNAVKIFSKADKLRELVFNLEPSAILGYNAAIENICEPFRFRETHVELMCWTYY